MKVPGLIVECSDNRAVVVDPGDDCAECAGIVDAGDFSPTVEEAMGQELGVVPLADDVAPVVDREAIRGRCASKGKGNEVFSVRSSFRRSTA